MAKPINMPQVGQDIETGTITEWRVAENDRVKKGDIIAVVESDKASFEVEVFESGVVLKRLYKEGEEAPVLQPIAYIGEPGEKIELETGRAPVPEKAPAAQESESGDGRDRMVAAPLVPEAPAAPGEPSAPGEPLAPARDRLFATPSARRVARETGVDLERLSGSGPHGRILKRDVLEAAGGAAAVQAGTPAMAAAAAARPKVPEIMTGDTDVPFSKMRQRIAARLTQSKRDIPHFYLFIDIDMTPALAWRTAYNERARSRVTLNDMIVKAAAAALVKHRGLNAHASAEGLVLKKQINIGIAVSTPEGLIVPVIENADKKDLAEIGEQARRNAEGARQGRLKAQALGTFTVSNLGMYEISFFLPIINPPECAILGVGAIEKRVVPTGASSMGVRDMLTLTLACDHRAVDGAEAAGFLAEMKRILQEYI